MLKTRQFTHLNRATLEARAGAPAGAKSEARAGEATSGWQDDGTGWTVIVPLRRGTQTALDLRAAFAVWWERVGPGSAGECGAFAGWVDWAAEVGADGGSPEPGAGVEVRVEAEPRATTADTPGGARALWQTSGIAFSGLVPPAGVGFFVRNAPGLRCVLARRGAPPPLSIPSGAPPAPGDVVRLRLRIEPS